MENIHSHLKELAILYNSSMKQIRNIESKAAISAINYQYINNMRHFVEHMFVGIEEAYSEPQKLEEAIDNFKDARHSIKNIVLDAGEYIAGIKLNEAKRHIVKGLSLSERKKAQEYFKQAVYQYDEGRNKRTGDHQEANEHFLKTIELCVAGILEVKPITKYQWIMFVLALSGWATFLARFFGLF